MPDPTSPSTGVLPPLQRRHTCGCVHEMWKTKTKEEKKKEVGPCRSSPVRSDRRLSACGLSRIVGSCGCCLSLAFSLFFPRFILLERSNSTCSLQFHASCASVTVPFGSAVISVSTWQSRLESLMTFWWEFSLRSETLVSEKRIQSAVADHYVMFTSPVSKKKHGRAGPKSRQHINSKSSISNHSSSSSSSDEELLIRRKNLPSVAKSELDHTERSRHRRPSSRSSVERHGRRCHPHPSPHHYHVQQTYSLDRSHPHGHAAGWCAPPAWSASPSPWLYPPAEIYPAVQRGSCCCCNQTPPVPCQVETFRERKNGVFSSFPPSIIP